MPAACEFCCNKGKNSNFSAAAWYFGRKLMEELKVPVGMIHSSWGGTIIEAWISEGAISAYPEMAAKLAQVKALSDNETEREKTFDQEIEAFTRQASLQDHGKSGGGGGDTGAGRLSGGTHPPCQRDPHRRRP